MRAPLWLRLPSSPDCLVKHQECKANCNLGRHSLPQSPSSYPLVVTPRVGYQILRVGLVSSSARVHNEGSGSSCRYNMRREEHGVMLRITNRAWCRLADPAELSGSAATYLASEARKGLGRLPVREQEITLTKDEIQSAKGPHLVGRPR